MKMEPTLPKYTVVIPTRERCDTLEWALRTCTTQNYDKLEIIVSDNFSQDRTREVVESFRDKRIRYVNTGRPLSMSENWEFALSHVSEGYLTYIGDDDGLLPDAVLDISRIIAETKTEAVSWKRCPYYWPDNLDEHARNLMVLPLRHELTRRNSAAMLQEVINFEREYHELPLLYNSFVSYEAVQRVLHQTGRFFCSSTPDVYSGFALACATESYYYSQRPYSIEGVSRHSNGMLLVGSPEYAARLTRKFLSENTIAFHPRLVPCPTSVTLLVAEAFLQAQEGLPAARKIELDMKKTLATAARQATRSGVYQFGLVMEAIQEIGRRNGLEEYAVQIAASHKNAHLPAMHYVPGVSLAQNVLMLYCSDFGVRNVYEASLLCRHLLTLKKLGYQTIGGIIKATGSHVKRQIVKRWRRLTESRPRETDQHIMSAREE